MREFAKQLFVSWDVDGDGNMTEKELIKPLVSLNLAPDLRAAKLICFALDPRTDKTQGTMELSAKDFCKILRPDYEIDRLIDVLTK